MPLRSLHALLFAILMGCADDTAAPASPPFAPAPKKRALPPAEPLAEPGAEARRLGEPPQLLRTDRVATMRLWLEPAAMAALADEPRDYVRGIFEYAGQRYPDVAVRFKGHRTLRKWHEKPSFKLNFSRYEKGRRFMGLKQLSLNNMVEDPTLLRETLGFHVMRALGVAAPRTGFAEVFVNSRRYGLYTMVEPVDERMLARHYGDGDGPLYEGEYGCDVYPGDALSMEHDDGKDPGRKQLLELAEAATGPIGELLHPERGLLDRERFFAFLAGSALIADFDGYRHAHNYRIYRDPTTKRWSLLPWGLDRVLKKDLDVYESYGLLARKCFDDAACRLSYVKHLRRLTERFESLDLPAEMARLETVVAEAAGRDRRRPHSDDERAEQLEKTRRFLRERPDQVRAQTACWDGERERDRDGDGHGCMDCDDEDPGIHPGAPERCDGTDRDCSGLADDAPQCPCPQESIEGATFSLCELPMTWPQAAAFCERRGEFLARIDGKDQSRALFDAAEELDDEVWWIGLNDRAAETELAWHDGAPVRFTYWAGGEPDHYACGQDCGALKKGGHGKWRDLHCQSPRPFICRKVQR